MHFASTKLDSLIDKASGELLLPCLNPDHWGIEDTLRAMPVMLQLALDHNMAEVTRMQEENLAQWIQDRRKFGVIGNLVLLCLPIRRANAEESFSSASCPVFWEGVNSSVGNHFEGLKRNEFDSSDVDVLASIVQLSFRLRNSEL